MKRGIVICSGIIAVVCVYLGITLLQEAKALKKERQDIDRQLEVKIKHLKQVEPYPIEPLVSIKEGYLDLVHHLNDLCRTYGLKAVLEVNKKGRSPNDAVDVLKKSSSWEGVYEISLKMRFYEMVAVDQRMVVFGFLEGIQDKFALQIDRIADSNKEMLVEFKLFGR